MTNRSARRAERRTRARPAGPSRAQTRYRMLVVVAILGLILLAVASAALVSSTSAPTSFL